MAERAAGAGLDVAPLSAFALEPLARSGIVLGYTEFPPPVLSAATRQLATALLRPGP